MASQQDTHATVEVDAHAGAHHEEKGVLDISTSMMMWTWVTFILMTVVLYKFAWKPILTALDKREEDIRKSVEDAEQAREALARITEREEQIIAAADDKAKEIVTSARKAATEAARVIERKAKEESRILIENAEREIRTASEKAQADLRRESATLAVQLSSKILQEKLDEANARDLTDRLIKDIS